MNTNLLLVGNTASGRKGVSLGHVRRVVSQADATWALRINSGLSSGEGLIWEVRDPIEKSEPVKEKGRIVSYQTVVADEGVTDKRLLVIQTEFARPLKAMQREGNTLSTVIREAWDSGNLNTMVKNSPARATNAHISVIGHVTAFELQQLLDRTDVANGFLNRFLVVVVRRSKCLPDGGSLEPEHFAPLVARVQAALEFGRGVGSMTRDPEARELWHREYPRLTADKPGAIGSVTSRAAPHVMRLACLYALLDRSSVVKRVHLAAALEINRYVEESVAYLFGGMLGDPTADAILAALREHSEGMTRTDIRDLFAGHRSKDEVDRALTALAGQGLATVTHIATGGRNKEIWTATKAMKASEAPSLPTAEGDTALLSLLSQPGKRIDI